MVREGNWGGRRDFTNSCLVCVVMKALIVNSISTVMYLKAEITEKLVI